MRTMRDPDAICKICGATKKQSLEIFEIMFTEKAKLTLCDLCNEQLLNKTLRASCNVNSKIKSKGDMSIIRKRKSERKEY